MSSFTIHSLDSALDQELGRKARQLNLSKNQLIKNILAGATGLATSPEPSMYGEFCGIWSMSDADEFERIQEDNSRIDPQEWLEGARP